jgi:hypothetical protein
MVCSALDGATFCACIRIRRDSRHCASFARETSRSRGGRYPSLSRPRLLPREHATRKLSARLGQDFNLIRGSGTVGRRSRRLGRHLKWGKRQRLLATSRRRAGRVCRRVGRRPDETLRSTDLDRRWSARGKVATRLGKGVNPLWRPRVLGTAVRSSLRQLIQWRALSGRVTHPLLSDMGSLEVLRMRRLQVNLTTLDGALSPEPGEARRDWWTANEAQHAVHCLPLLMANRLGYVIRSPANFRSVGLEIGNVARISSF